MKKLFLLILAVPTLLGCSTGKASSYTGQKMEIEYAENGGFVDIDPAGLFDKAHTNKIDSIYLIGDSTCEACNTLKESMENWAKVYHAVLYYLPVSSITSENEHYLVDATEGYYAWKEADVVPTTYFFMQGGVAMKGDDENTLNYLQRYVDVKDKA